MTMIANSNLPATVEQAVRALLGLVPLAEQTKIAAMSEADLPMLHFDLGQWIRNHFGLWSGNDRLLHDTGRPDPDDVLVHLVVRDSLAGHAVYRRFVFEGSTVAPPPGPAR